MSTTATAATTVNIPSLFMVFLTPALGGTLLGYDVGATSFVLAKMLTDTNTSVWWHHVSTMSLLQGTIVSAMALGAVFGSLLVFKVASLVGRRSEIRFAAFLYLFGASLNTLAGRNDWSLFQGASLLLVGRFVYGIAVGFAMHGAPTYMAEMSPASLRGMVVTGKELFIVVGMMLGYSSGYFVSRHDGYSWTFLYGIAGMIAFPMLILSFFIPRSTRWLLLNNQFEEALESMKFVLNGNVEMEFDLLRKNVMVETTNATTTTKSQQSIFSKKYRRAFVTTMGLLVLQQVTGQPSVVSYVTVMFGTAGLDESSSILVSAFMMACTAVAVVLVDRRGRKLLLYIGCTMMFTALMILSILFTNDNTNNGEDGATTTKTTASTLKLVVILFAMFVYIGGFQFGFGPVSWLLLSEMFPLEIRGEAVAFGVQVNFLLNFVVQSVIPILEDSIGLGATFGLFGFAAGFAIFFVYKYVPETKGLTLEEIQDVMQRQDEEDGDDEQTPLLEQQGSSSTTIVDTSV